MRARPQDHSRDTVVPVTCENDIRSVKLYDLPHGHPQLGDHRPHHPRLWR